jgi:hypothetical protein
VARSAEARKTLAALDTELRVASERRGENLVWTASERVVLAAIAAVIDRKVWLARAYSRCDDDVKLRVKLSAELRLLESSLARMVKQITPDMPAATSLRSQKAQRAARARWDRARDATGA